MEIRSSAAERKEKCGGKVCQTVIKLALVSQGIKDLQENLSSHEITKCAISNSIVILVKREK